MELLDKSPRRFAGCRLCFLALLLGLAARATASPDGFARLGRKANLLHELGRLRVLDPEAKSLADAPAGLLERPAVRVAPPNARHACDPRSGLVPFEDHPVRRALLHGQPHT